MGTEGSPAFSVMVVCYNHEHFARQALESVAAQTCQDLELVVTDDVSSDDTRRVITDWIAETGYPARTVFNEENTGLPALLNAVIPTLRGDYVIVLAGDDWMLPDRLERQLRRFEQSGPETALVYSDVLKVFPDGEPMGIWREGGDRPEGDVYLRLFRDNFVPAASATMRRSAYDVVGPYDETLPIEDYDMWLRVSQHFEVAYEPGVVACYRQHDAALTKTLGIRSLLSAHRSVEKHLGTDRRVDRAVRQRMAVIALKMHSRGDDPDLARRYLRSAVVRYPSPHVVRAVVTAHVRRG